MATRCERSWPQSSGLGGLEAPDRCEREIGPTATSRGPLVYWVVAAQRGDLKAQEWLYRQHAAMVNRLARRLAPSAQEADDLAQDTFAKALESLARLREPEAFAGWIRSILIRLAATRIRRRKLARHLGLLASETPDSAESHAQPCNLEAAVELGRVHRLLLAMPTHAGIALILHRQEGMTIPEVAEQMGVSEGTVKRRLRQARTALDKLREVGAHVY